MKIVNHNITLVRGDTGSITITNAKSPFASGDTVQLTVKNKTSGTTVINMEATTFTDGAAVFSFEHSTTKDLTCGCYIYSIRSIRSTGEYHTLIREKDFILTAEGNPEIDDDEE